MTLQPFLDLANAAPNSADVTLLPLPYEATACYGKGTARGPEAIWRASTHIELWDEELDFDLDSLKFHSAAPITPVNNETAEKYLERVYSEAALLHRQNGLVIGIGGEHSLTPSLVRAATKNSDDYSNLTVVQIDAHSDLRDSYQGTPYSHACAMRRLVEKGATVIAIGIRSAEREEFEYGVESNRVQTFFAHELAGNPQVEETLMTRLEKIQGDVYLTIDIDGLEVSLCPGTGTPQPGGLSWWQTLKHLRCLLRDNQQHHLIGCDLVETAPMSNTQVNEFTAARLLAKVITYQFVSKT